MSSENKPFKRGYPDDLPIRPANLIQLDWHASTRNMINIWMPESVSSSSHGTLVMILREPVNYHFTRTGEDCWSYWFEKPGVLRLEGGLGAIEGGVAMALEVRNLSGQLWYDVSAGICVQLHAAPDFYDPNRERTFYLSGGRLRTMEGPCKETTAGAFYGPRLFPDYPEADVGFMGIRSEDNRYVVASWWESASTVWGNAHRATLCIHTNPEYQDIAPGESKRRRGRLYLMAGTPEDALERFKADSGFPCA